MAKLEKHQSQRYQNQVDQVKSIALWLSQNNGKNVVGDVTALLLLVLTFTCFLKTASLDNMI